MAKNEAMKVDVPADLLPAIRAILMLSPASQELVTSLTGQLAAREGITVDAGDTSHMRTPAEGIELWLSKLQQESYSEGTIRVYQSAVQTFLKKHPTPTHLDIQKYLADQLKLHSSSHVATQRKALRSLFSFLHEEGLWTADPTMKLRSIKVTYIPKEPPSMEEVQRLMTYDCWKKDEAEKFKVMTLLITTTALRVSEAAGLKKAWVFPDRHEIRVMGKGKKIRTIPLLPIIEGELLSYMGRHPSDTPYVFPGETRLGYWSVSSYEKTLSRACAKLKMRHFTPHYLRHFYATFALKHGARLEVVSKILGHASVAITADIYNHVQTEDIQDTAQRYAPLAGMTMKQLAPPTVEGEFKELPPAKEAPDA